MGFCAQLGLLLWKNWILQKRRKWVSIFEIILPAFFAVLILLLRKISKADEITSPTTYDVKGVNSGLGNYKGIGTIGYYPETSETSLVMQSVLRMLILIVIVSSSSFLPDYTSEGFNYLQVLLGEALAKYWVQKDGGDTSGIHFRAEIQRMPYPPYILDIMIPVLQTSLPIFLILSFILSVIINTKNLVYEKENKLKESMKLMGLQASVHWVSWFITFSVYLVPVMAIYALLFGLNLAGTKGPVLTNTDPSLFFVFLLCYGVALITFSFMVSTFVQRANVGATLAGILFFVSYLPWNYISPKYKTMGKGSKLASGLVFNCAMALGANVIGIHEGTGEGVRWSNFHKPGVVDDNLSLLECMLLLLFDSLLHCIVTWYLDNVWPGEFGVPKPYYFPFMKTYWFGSKTSSSSKYEFENSDTKHFEKDPAGLKAGIQIAQLRKAFGKKVAVDGTSLKMYNGQITVLLGHNGAGKTTTMSMLTGFIPPTSGTAEVNGCDIRKDIQGVRRSLGLCPQHNILFDSLTVKEHLLFFAKLKGIYGAEMEKEVLTTVQEVGLQEKLLARACSLSGGQKRKLSVGIALIGGSKVVILDEPTAGMDPAARRQTWTVLQQARQNRTVVLSTHYMDEADLLGDRIAIMAEGVVKCCGSSMFLKKLYGAGYHLVVVKGPKCNVDSLTELVQSHIPTAELESVINTEVSYILPDSESARFPALFTELDDHKDQLGITSFGTSATTMEEVFLKVGESAYDHQGPIRIGGELYTNQHVHGATNNEPENEERVCLTNAEEESRYKSASEEHIDIASEDMMAFNRGFQKKTGLSLKLGIIRGLFVKKALHTWRNRIITLVQLLLPVFLVTIVVARDKSESNDNRIEPPLTLDLEPYGHSYIPVTAGLNPSPARTKFTSLYMAQFGKSHTVEEFSKPPYDLNNYTLKRATELGTATYNKKMIIGMESIEPSGSESLAAVAFYNGQPYHAVAVSMNYLVNTFLQATLNNSFSLQTTVAPLPKEPREEKSQAEVQAHGEGFLVGFLISFAMAFLTSLFIYFPVKERQVGAKHLQVVSGVGPVTYWLPTFMWDFINYIIPSLLLIIVFAASSVSAYVDEGRFALVILTLVLYGWAVLPFIYALQFLFTSPPTGVVVVIIMNILTGLFTLLSVFLLTIDGLGTENIGNTLDWIFKALFPNYNLGSCFKNIYANFLMLEQCADVVCSHGAVSPCCKDTCAVLKACASFDENYLAWEQPGIGSYLLMMLCQGIFFLIIVMLVEYRVFQKFWYLIGGLFTKSFASRTQGPFATEDSDVAAENERVNAIANSLHTFKEESADSLLLVNLYKSFGSLVAVNGISLGVPEQECFGLLGQNGAGKTTTFKMLTGDMMVTSGNAYLKGFDVRNNMKKVQANMGYCPQFDALIDQMTGRETLTMYARLRGVPEENIKDVVNSLMDVLMLKPHADKLAGKYSGGNKRKLSTAMAIIGDPPFIMLDEPSAGMDPKARRQLWNVLSQVRASGRTLVLTSHSMEECDALCTRLAIMVNGRFMCLGSPQHLKNKFGQGYTLIVQMGALPDGATAPNQPAIDFIVQNFPGAKVFEDHQGYIHFQVPDTGLKLAQVFSLMESTKANLSVQDYSVHQTTLEQVFLTFTRTQAIIGNQAAKRSCMPCFS
ncbi:hypothetical protein EGW08_009334 [Elysia chlorotica]|uniref:ABC transporter domain-containing protein n=1 Tax=Elysia chlorotica TaxID=188477 RepID=A0A433TN08_ELYCH|nr:hypothetical protein EGW08_009334 [Elysia chlorotica]